MRSDVFTSKFVFWFGVVESRDDPERMGRVRVRCFGYHTSDKATLPTDDLPWATVIMPSTSASVSGVGQSPSGLVPGSWVVGFFADGHDAQMPIVMGSISGIPSELPNPNEGFADPSGTYPKVAGVPDTSPLAIGGDAYTTHPSAQSRASRRRVGVPMASGGTWDEPAPQSPPTYPLCKVTASESGHVREIDDTPGSERTLDQHASGTFVQVIADGTVVDSSAGGRVVVTDGASNAHCAGKVSLTADDGAEVLINGSVAIKVVGGGIEIRSEGDVNIHVAGKLTETVDGDVERRVSGSLTETIGGSYTRVVGGSSSERSGGSHSIRAGVVLIN